MRLCGKLLLAALCILRPRALRTATAFIGTVPFSLSTANARAQEFACVALRSSPFDFLEKRSRKKDSVWVKDNASIGRPLPRAGANGEAPKGAGGLVRKIAPFLQKEVAPSVDPWTVLYGDSLRTWTFPESSSSSSVSSYANAVRVYLRTFGRPLDALVETWDGPDNTPQSIGVYVEDGRAYPFEAVLMIPGGRRNMVAVRNRGEMEMPVEASVRASAADIVDAPYTRSGPVPGSRGGSGGVSDNIQGGGTVRTVPLVPAVRTVRIHLRTTDGRPLSARIELLRGPNNVKQAVEVYSEDGLSRPFYALMEIPTRGGNVVRIANTAPMEYPLVASVEPLRMVDLSSVPVGGGNEGGYEGEKDDGKSTGAAWWTRIPAAAALGGLGALAASIGETL